MNWEALCSWSGGKDSCYALIKAIEQGYKPQVLLSVLNEEGKITRSHGIPEEIIHVQAKAAGLAAYTTASSWADYETKFIEALGILKTKHNVHHAVFGDIDFEPHREWEERVCATAGLQVVLPLWKEDRKQLVLQMLAEGMQAMIVSCNEILGEKFLGEILTPDTITAFEALGIDPCGENGEYHTLVLDCSLFSKKLEVEITEKMKHENYWFCRLSIGKE